MAWRGLSGIRRPPAIWSYDNGVHVVALGRSDRKHGKAARPVLAEPPATGRFNLRLRVTAEAVLERSDIKK
jgi:hypothetical protein